jgi:hypothetical protein
VYEDLWLPSWERARMEEFGIMNENMRKILSDDDTADKTATEDVSLMKISDNYIKIKLGQILNNQGAYPNCSMKSLVKYLIKLPAAEEIMVAQQGQKVADYKILDSWLEYETITAESLYNDSVSTYSQKNNIPFVYVTHNLMKTVGKNETVINDKIQLPRKRMRAIAYFFFDPNRKDSEEYLFPNITKVSLNCQGHSNVIYPNGMVKKQLYNEAMRVFLTDKNNDAISRADFYKDKFALVIDLKAYRDTHLMNTGIRTANVCDGVSVRILKEPTATDLEMRIFVLADANIEVSENTISELKLT